MSFGQFNTSSAIVPMDQQQYHHHQPQPMGIPNVKRQPLGGRKSHKLLDEASTQNLFVARLPRSLGNDELLALFAEFHPLTATVMMDVGTGKSKGFGFVTFESVEQGQVALEAMSSRLHQSPGESKFTLDIHPSTFNGQRIVAESRYVYFRNFPAQVFQDLYSAYGLASTSFEREVSAYFSQLCGSLVNSVEFHGRAPTSPSSGDMVPAFLVSFDSQADAEAAIAACHGKVLFPDLSATPAMAKFADLTTVKAMDRRRKRETSSAGSSTPLSSPEVASAAPIVPTDRNLSIGRSIDSQVPYHATTPLVTSPLVTCGGEFEMSSSWLSDSSASSHRSSGSVSRSSNSPDLAAQPSHYRNDPYNTVSSSLAVSDGRGALRRHATPICLGHRSQVHRYRRDPYSQCGYVMVSSSSSSSSCSDEQGSL